MKKICIALYVLIIIVMAAITIVEKYMGTEYVSAHCYGAWWFSLLWALLAAAAVVYIIRQRMRRWWVVMLHASLVCILAGALLTHLTAWKGMVHLRVGEQTNNYLVLEDGDTKQRILPFVLRLDNFDIKYHPGTKAAADYSSQLTITDGTIEEHFTVSMNNIHTYQNIRFYQTSYDQDGRGSVLTLNSDPWGIPVTYLGYGMLFLSLIYMLIDPHGNFRRLLAQLTSVPHEAGKKTLLLGALVMLSASAMAEGKQPHVLPRETAEKFGQLYILYNNRICPLETYALDFTKKLYGKSHYGAYTAEQVLTGFIFWGDEWCNEPILKIKGSELKETFDLPGHTTVNRFFVESMGGYILGPHVEQYYQGNTDAFHKQAAAIDDKISLVMQLRRGAPLKLFPWSANGKTEWLSPTDGMPTEMTANNAQFVTNVFSLLYEEVLAGNYAQVEQIVEKMRQYQVQHAKGSLPAEHVTRAEHIYNKVSWATILFMVNLTLGFVTFFFYLLQLRTRKPYRVFKYSLYSFFFLSWTMLTVALALRWVVCGRVPMSNGYESMLTMAWFVMFFVAIVAHRLQQSTLVLAFGFLLSGFFLLVSHINQMDPQISHIMPVLDSPLLSLHVSIIMMAYALLALTFICALTALLLPSESEKLALLSRVFLYPAISTLGIGIFTGAIWANVSWGTYWSWDPKETWALISFMTYAVVLHTQSLPVFRNARTYHIYMLAAFLTLIMTYFGVNYFLGGMHSYA